MSSPVSVWKYSLSALGLVVLLNLVLRYGVKLEGMSVNVGIAAGVGALLGAWFAKSVRRVPLPKERSSLLWQYGTPIALFHIFAGYMAASINKLSLPGVFILFLSFIVYPAFAQLFLSEKRVTAFLKK
jgi:hypothetical protein